MAKVKETHINYYDVLGVPIDCTEKDILKAYRKKALKCHPDKNPDNPKAADIFIKLSEALNVLTDDTARALLDKVLKAKEAAKLRAQKFDSTRKKFKDDLERREREAEEEKERGMDDAEKLAALIRSLRTEGNRLVKQQQDLLEQQLAEERKLKIETAITPKLKVKWKASKRDHQNGGYTDGILTDLFGRYGPVLTILLSRKKNGMAVVEFGKQTHASLAMEFEKGLPDNPLTEISWLEAPPSQHSCPSVVEKEAERSGYCDNDNTGDNSDRSAKRNPGSEPQKKPTTLFPSAASSQQPTHLNTMTCHEDFESLVLQRMRQAEDRKRLVSQIIESDKLATDAAAGEEGGADEQKITSNGIENELVP